MRSIRILVQLRLHERIVDNSQAEQAKHQIEHGVIRYVLGTLLLHISQMFTHLVRPDEGPDTACDNGKQKMFAAGEVSISAKSSCILGNRIEPKQPVQTASNKSKYYR